MRFSYHEQRAIACGSLKIMVCTGRNEYMPTNEEVLELAKEIFGFPTREIYEKIEVRLYWHQNVRIFELLIEGVMKKGIFRQTFDMELYSIMEDASEAGCASDWIVTIGSNRIDEIYGKTMVKIV